jgi:hypothetical protein
MSRMHEDARKEGPERFPPVCKPLARQARTGTVSPGHGWLHARRRHAGRVALRRIRRARNAGHPGYRLCVPVALHLGLALFAPMLGGQAAETTTKVSL